MTDIHHRIGVLSSSTDDVYAALTTIDGLSRVVDDRHRGRPRAGREDLVPLVPGGFDMEVIELAPGELSPVARRRRTPEWIGTTIDWRLSRTGGFTIVPLHPRGIGRAGGVLCHCSTKWAWFLLSLKALVETGTGAPSPDDVAISDWH